MQIEIPENTWLKGEYVKDNKIEEVTILDEGRPVNGEFGFKVETKVKYKNQKDEDPDSLSWNKTSAKILEKFFGRDTLNWVGKTVPIEVSRTEKGYAIYPDEKLMEKVYQQIK